MDSVGATGAIGPGSEEIERRGTAAIGPGREKSAFLGDAGGWVVFSRLTVILLLEVDGEKAPAFRLDWR